MGPMPGLAPRAVHAVAAALMLVAVAMELAPPMLQRYLVDHILKDGDAAPDAPGLPV